MSYTTIEEYNNYLVENKNIDIDIIEYVKEINKLISNIDISFIDDFIELVYKDTCCIPHSMLKKYGIFNLTGGSSDVNRLMKQYGFIIDKDYICDNIVSSSNGGRNHKNEYYLHPDTFKICLIRSQKTLVYTKYFILLEKSIKYYIDYQNILKINKLIEKHKNQIEEQKKDYEKQIKQQWKMINFRWKKVINE